MLLLRHLDEGVFIERVTLNNVLVGNLVPSVGIHLEILDAVARLPVELVESDLLALGGSWIERYGAGDERQSKKAFPIGTGAMYAELRIWPSLDSRRSGEHGSDIKASSN
jgi:hypothetical protein